MKRALSILMVLCQTHGDGPFVLTMEDNIRYNRAGDGYGTQKKREM